MSADVDVVVSGESRPKWYKKLFFVFIIFVFLGLLIVGNNSFVSNQLTGSPSFWYGWGGGSVSATSCTFGCPNQSLNVGDNVSFGSVYAVYLFGLLDASNVSNSFWLNSSDQRFNDSLLIPLFLSNLSNDMGFINSSYANATYYLTSNPSSFISAAQVPAAETDAAHDSCSEISGCVVGAISDGNTNWDNVYGFISSESDPVFVAGNSSIWGAINGKLSSSGGVVNGDVWINGKLYVLGDFVNLTVQNIFTNGSFIPAFNNSFDLGSSSFYFRSLYADNIYSKSQVDVLDAAKMSRLGDSVSGNYSFNNGTVRINNPSFNVSSVCSLGTITGSITASPSFDEGGTYYGWGGNYHAVRVYGYSDTLCPSGRVYTSNYLLGEFTDEYTESYYVITWGLGGVTNSANFTGYRFLKYDENFCGYYNDNGVDSVSSYYDSECNWDSGSVAVTPTSYSTTTLYNRTALETVGKSNVSGFYIGQDTKLYVCSNATVTRLTRNITLAQQLGCSY